MVVRFHSVKRQSTGEIDDAPSANLGDVGRRSWSDRWTNFPIRLHDQSGLARRARPAPATRERISWMTDRRTPHRLTSTAALAVSIMALSTAARAQGGPGYAPPTTGAPPPAAGNPPPDTGAAPPATTGSAAAPGAPAAPPASSPAPGAGAPPPPVYAPGYAPPSSESPPPAYAPPPGYAPPPRYAPPGYGPPGYPPPPRAYSTGNYYPPGYGAPPPPEHLHDGFYLRLHLGGGATHLSGADGFGNTVTASGGSGSFGVAIGGAIAPNFILFGTLFGVGFSPTVKVGGVDAGLYNSSAALAGIGGGAAYYFEPVNLYLSAALAFTSAEIDDTNSHPIYQTRDGIGVQLMVGKEWWISQDWGIGVAGEFIGASMKDKNDSSVTWSADAFSILFSATYN
jgi:hypothetical protein